MTATASSKTDPGNPFDRPWSGPYGAPEFDRVRPEHFAEAYPRAYAAHWAEIQAIAENPDPPTFENTIEAIEDAARLLGRLDAVFQTFADAHTNDEFLALERELSPVDAAHWDKVMMHQPLFRRVEALYEARDRLGLSPEQLRLLERHHTAHRRSGAALDPESKARLAAINERLAVLGTAFSQNVLADEQHYALVLESEDDLAGLPPFVREAAQATAEERGFAGKHVITLARSSVEPFLQFSARRDLREKTFRAWVARGESGGATDNKANIAETVKLRSECANLLGYETYAHYRLDDRMAKTPQAARALLEKVWTPARARALADRDAMQEMIRKEGGNFALAPWDWRYYAEKLRKVRCDVDETEVKPYLQLERIVEAAFDTAHRLFGLTFVPVEVPVWHPDVRTWEVRGADGSHVGLFYGDYFARSTKRSGAWMETIRNQENFRGAVRPIVGNVMNFNKGQPTLLSFDDARTLFHEFGHAMHGLLSDVSYPTLQGTSTLTDWVELPSQLYEHWLERPEVLGRFAVHAETGQPMPEALLRKVMAARNFNRASETLEYLASALVDLDLHLLPSIEGIDIGEFERLTLERIGMPSELVMRHRLPHFAHVFSGGFYAAGYYSYMWSEVLDCDAFEAFEEAGDVFDSEIAARLKRYVLSTGGSRDPAELYIAFRGRLPDAKALLKRRGFADAA